MTDDDVDRALGSLTDASPSPGLRANVMRRIADEVRRSDVRSSKSGVRRSRRWAPAPGWQVALAGAAVILLAAAVWLAVRSGPAPQTVTTRTHAHDVTLPPSPEVRTTPGAETTTAAQTGQSGMRPDTESGRRRQVHAVPTQTATVLERTARAPAAGDSANPASVAASPQVAALPELTIPPLPPPDALVVTPLALDSVAVERMDIPPLDVGPVGPEVNGRRH